MKKVTKEYFINVLISILLIFMVVLLLKAIIKPSPHVGYSISLIVIKSLIVFIGICCVLITFFLKNKWSTSVFYTIIAIVNLSCIYECVLGYINTPTKDFLYYWFCIGFLVGVTQFYVTFKYLKNLKN